jgi:FkbH-like protein
MSALAVLGDAESTVANVMKAVAELEDDYSSPSIRFGISANITADLLGVYLRRHALLTGGSAEVLQGAFDSHLDNVQRFVEAGVDHLLLINFFDQLAPALEARLTGMDAAELAGLRERLCDELRLALTEASGVKAVVVTTFHRFTAPATNPLSAEVDRVIDDFNAGVEDVVEEFPNAITISARDAVSAVGRDQALSPRFYFRATAPYLPHFWNELASRIMLATRGAGTYLYKALVLDADNTLWGGVLGEDLLEGIALGPESYPGNVYWRVQQELLALQRRGVLLCLATKNNPSDLDEALERHRYQVLRDQHLIIKKAGWYDKVDSIEGIAADLGIGLESIVFLDDSRFEIESVRERLPSVRCFEVPQNLSDYPALVTEISDLFLAGRPDDGGTDKTAQYRMRAAERAASQGASSREEYLASLGLTVELRRDPRDLVGRISGLSQKSNQFNVTTRRYTEAEVLELFDSPEATVYTLGVSDRFGDAGITGIAVVLYDAEIARVEAFLMSCRVLGRGIERAPWPTIAADARAHGCVRLEAKWIRSARNEQVEDLYDQLGLTLVESGDDRRRYAARLDEIVFDEQTHIEVRHG